MPARAELRQVFSMQKKVPLYAVIIIAVLTVVLTFNTCFLFFEQKYNLKLNETLSQYAYFDKLLNVDEVVKKYYIGKTDKDELTDAVIRGYLEGIGDKYALYMTSEEFEKFERENNGSLVGIGINVVYDAENKAIQVIWILPDSPAETAGLHEGDTVTAIDGKKVSDVGYYTAIDMIQGEAGTKVTLTVSREGKNIDIICERREVKTYSVTHRIFSRSPEIGVIRINEFNKTTPDQLKSSIEELKKDGCTKFVFDLRNNPGGELESVVRSLDILLPEGPIAHIFYHSGESEQYKSDAACLDAKVAVLTNKNTASAAELFTCALKDYTEHGNFDATVVGTKTYGKGVIQKYYILRDGSAFKISVGRYDPPYSENYDIVGVSPDIEVELSPEAQKLGIYRLDDNNDDQLIEAVKALNK